MVIDEGDAMQNRIIRRSEVLARIGLSSSTMYAMIAEGKFPKPMRLGKRAVGWKENDLDAWLESLQPHDGDRHVF